MADILIVDADAGVLSTLGLLIAAEGYVVRTATNGNDALDLARASRPDVLITDTRTPGLSGPALVREMLQAYLPEKHRVLLDEAA